MTNEPDRIRAEVAELLGEPADLSATDSAAELDSLALRLEQAHELLVRALESVEKG